jgi:hypothetical protein
MSTMLECPTTMEVSPTRAMSTTLECIIADLYKYLYGAMFGGTSNTSNGYSIS